LHLDGVDIGELSVLAELQSLLPGFQDLDRSTLTPTVRSKHKRLGPRACLRQWHELCSLTERLFGYFKEKIEMPKAWSSKDERKYQHIKKAQQERGSPARRAKEIAARTVNRDRRQEGRTPKKSTSGTGNPHRPLEQRTVDELRNRARELEIEGRSYMNKDTLVTAIRDAE
jgi:hypothetical protein